MLCKWEGNRRSGHDASQSLRYRLSGVDQGDKHSLDLRFAGVGYVYYS